MSLPGWVIEQEERPMEEKLEPEKVNAKELNLNRQTW
jgi:hypothetical protein